MKKIPTIFKRNYEVDFKVMDEISPGCEWVLAGEGVATRKYDGTACLVGKGFFYRRYERKQGTEPPPTFLPAEDLDEKTGKQLGWVEVVSCSQDRIYLPFIDMIQAGELAEGTYELVGPKVNGNHEKLESVGLVRHADAEPLPDAPRDFNGLREYLSTHDIEGIVWHHPDGRMAKIKGKDFGIKRPA